MPNTEAVPVFNCLTMIMQIVTQPTELILCDCISGFFIRFSRSILSQLLFLITILLNPVLHEVRTHHNGIKIRGENQFLQNYITSIKSSL